jgi:transcription termination factor NusB
MGRRESRDAAVKMIFQQGFQPDEEIMTEAMISTFIDNAQYFDDDDTEKENDLNYTKELDMPYLKNVLDGVLIIWIDWTP